jgi:hypothetical protein
MRYAIAAAILAMAFAAGALPQNSIGATGGRSLEIRKVMTSEQFDEAGLTKLTPVELHALEVWLVSYTKEVARVVSPPAAAGATSPKVIETCIAGEFEGWEGETIFKLCNGEIWQQSEYAYMYQYAYRPEVVIYLTSTGYRMKVDDVSETIGVERLK